MMRLRSCLDRLGRDSAGTMIIETAIIAPVLILLSLGAYQVSSLVARQGELQSAMGIAEGVALASQPNTDEKRTTLKNIIAASTGLSAANIQVAGAYRCNSGQTVYNAESSCTAGDKVSRYVRIQLTDSFVPAWREFGMGKDITLNLDRYILIEQKTKT